MLVSIMIYTDLTRLSIKIAFDAHKNQLDRSGIPYICHPLHLAEQMKDEISCCAALLHDVVEDTDIGFDDLYAMGIPQEFIAVLRLLTHEKNTPYMEYIENIKKSRNETAIAVKRADIIHNSDVTRTGDVSDKETLLRMEKYKVALEILAEDSFL